MYPRCRGQVDARDQRRTGCLRARASCPTCTCWPRPWTQRRSTSTSCVADVPAVLAAAESMWDVALADAFDPTSDGFSGSLPVLETVNEALRKLYWWGVLGVIWFRRDNPASVLGRTYDTLMPRYWQTTTFIWDYSLSSLTHALLDPAPMRKHIEHWIDLRHPRALRHRVADRRTGRAVVLGQRLRHDPAGARLRPLHRRRGVPRQLSGRPSRKPVAEHLHDWATAWRGLRGEHALADYGGIDNLLECVSSYVHEVASFNAANVWCLRVAAEVADRAGDDGPRCSAAQGGVARRQATSTSSTSRARASGTRASPTARWSRSGTATTSTSSVRRSPDDLSESQRAEMVDVLPARAADADVDARAVAVRRGRRLQRPPRPPVERRLPGVAGRRGARTVRARARRRRSGLAARSGQVREPGPVRPGALRRGGAAADGRWRARSRRRSSRT